MSTISTKPPSGMRDFLAKDVMRRRFVTATLSKVYESFGFVPLETPTIENLTTLLGKYGAEGDQLLYRILHRRERLDRALAQKEVNAADLADEGLRYDLTVPLARVVANYRDLPAFYKRYQIQPVWRADRPAKGRFREFYQCDVDLTGTSSLLAEAEVCGVVCEALTQLGFAEFDLLVNHRELLRALVLRSEIPIEREGTALVALDKLDKIGKDGVLQELLERGIGKREAEQLLHHLETARSEDGLTRLSEDSDTQESAQTLSKLLALLSSGPASGHVRFEPTLARGLSYYTGPIFEITVPGFKGSVGGGGRYDGLVGMFLGRKVPAVGFSLGLERVLLVMEERSMFPALGVAPNLVLCWFADVAMSEVVRIARVLRKSVGRVEIYPEAVSIGKQIQYASQLGAEFAGLLGANEVAEGRLTLKHLASGKQRTVPLMEAAAAMDTGFADG